jgi:hypothetical protein
MDYLSMVISVIALFVSFYFSYKPFQDQRRGLKSKLRIYRGVFQAMVEEWEFNRKWIEELKNNPTNEMYKGSIYFPVSIFEMYPLNDSDLIILSGLGSYEGDFGYGAKEMAPYLKLKFFIQNFISESFHSRTDEYIRYDFADVKLAEHYVNNNGNSDFRFSVFLVGFLDSAMGKL